MELSKCKIGIRPTIDGRWGGIREGLEEQTMGMAKAAKALIDVYKRQTHSLLHSAESVKRSQLFFD